ncbi:hypothetical protein I3843_16G068900 [Carya illinoinensis]|nr:hypothetical protein I3760_16G070900 [Carya illinoinensis]KAG7941858.1 hypothetical protein I3843_16G068900 [Carya illinoinensis]
MPRKFLTKLDTFLLIRKNIPLEELFLQLRMLSMQLHYWCAQKVLWRNFVYASIKISSHGIVHLDLSFKMA